MIEYLRIELGLYIFAPVCYGRIGRIELQIFNAVGYASEGQCLGNIGENPSVLCLPLFHKGGKAHALQIVKAQLGRYVRKCLYRNYIQGLLDTVAQCTGPLVARIPVIDRPPVGIGIGLVYLYVPKGL